MPTANRRAFVRRAIAYFLRQDYPKCELIIVDDGADPVHDLVPEDERIRYIRLQARASVGAKRNLACEQAQGEIIAHWDDDDWYAPTRLRVQVYALLREGTSICGASTLLFYDADQQRAWRYTYPANERRWVSGNTLCYRREVWSRLRFSDTDVGEDATFVWKSDPRHITVLPESGLHVGMIHAGNVSPKATSTAWWDRIQVEEVRRVLGDDWNNYGSEDPDFFTIARRSHLALPEFAAFNQGATLPWMRRWELPYALFQSRLGNAMAVLDCTMNPVDFEARLLRLYPHTLYRRWNPIQNSVFALPFGVPDGAFDRVYCVNTLEHLLRPQREALVAAMARKLKPGGLLVLTSDYYFDSSWQNPVFLNSGVMRADRTELFNGWNRVTPSEWTELCASSGLTHLAEPCAEPNEHDTSLYRNAEPYPHASVGGVFIKSELRALPAAKKIVLALLTWNTCDVSVDSIAAYVQEAQMLTRLGHEPLICVCDNGSTDGTAERLRGMDAEIGLEHRFIYNSQNLGNSVARNQIIDVALEFGADYVLFMDGDIEIVPFSSFAMMRYMEDSGSRLGCIGPHSGGQTKRREQGLTLAAIGVLFGLVGAFGVTRVIRTLLYRVTPTDPASFVGVAAFLTLIAVLASYLPARRATTVDPVVALRND
jgi:glycosyltransferase involved in cell wall biosynthesis